MDEVEPVGDPGPRTSRPVFVSYATTDRKQALAVCKAIESRGARCWISARDVAPGDNYQEAIVQSIRNARAMVLVFSGAANKSDEIKKELSLASRYKVPVLALRIEDVDPDDAFAYELSTRQWIDAFEGWERSIDLLIGRIEQIGGAEPLSSTNVSSARRRTAWFSRPLTTIAALFGLLILMIAGAAWWWLRPNPAAEHSMTVRLAGFKLLSTDLPATISDIVDAEISAAFNADGAIGVSTASAAVPGAKPTYALGGTIQRNGEKVRVITRLVNELSGATVWSDNYNYDGNEVAKVPRHIAVDAGNVVRCGLFGASTYHKPLPDAVLRDYMQFCQGHWNTNMGEGRKALIPAQRVVAALPDFSWGWAAVAGGWWKVASNAESDRQVEEARASGREAADRAVALNSKNSEALYIKSMLIGRRDWIGREKLLQQAVAAKRLDCGCEYHQYGWMLANVGRIAEAVDQLRQANDMLALYVYTTLSLADALAAAGKPDEAATYYDASIELASNAGFANRIALWKATAIGNVTSLLDPKLPLSAEQRSALVKGYRAVASRDAGAKTEAIQALTALTEKEKDTAVARLLVKLGANHEAFVIATRLTEREFPGASVFWSQDMRGTLNDPGFPAVAAKLGLINYWKTTGTRPDVCGEKASPPFCELI